VERSVSDSSGSSGRSTLRLVECAPDAIVSADYRQRIVQFNPAAESMFLWRAEEVAGRPLETLLC
jgi:PAS domain S-box-containing protein